MRDINEVLPKIPNMRWGALMNYYPTNPQLKHLNKMMPHDRRWHTIISHDNEVNFDGKVIRRRSAESLTWASNDAVSAIKKLNILYLENLFANFIGRFIFEHILWSRRIKHLWHVSLQSSPKLNRWLQRPHQQRRQKRTMPMQMSWRKSKMKIYKCPFCPMIGPIGMIKYVLQTGHKKEIKEWNIKIVSQCKCHEGKK